MAREIEVAAHNQEVVLVVREPKGGERPNAGRDVRRLRRGKIKIVDVQEVEGSAMPSHGDQDDTAWGDDLNVHVMSKEGRLREDRHNATHGAMQANTGGDKVRAAEVSHERRHRIRSTVGLLQEHNRAPCKQLLKKPPAPLPGLSSNSEEGVGVPRHEPEGGQGRWQGGERARSTTSHVQLDRQPSGGTSA